MITTETIAGHSSPDRNSFLIVIEGQNGLCALPVHSRVDGPYLYLTLARPLPPTCVYCEHDDVQCTYMSSGQKCTRRKGHSGPHVACCGADHERHIWPNERQFEIVE